ncbi:MAG: hypothetical protein HC934_02875 [Acaryochloridaceae cyanobacterium SU_2_1]|nr:hypothetical protein [Acaryochloridaceae cyanobacterium SU_2_1]
MVYYPLEKTELDGFSELSKIELHLLLWLKSQHPFGSQIPLATRSFAEQLQCSVRSVQRAIRHLCDLALIAKEGAIIILSPAPLISTPAETSPPLLSESMKTDNKPPIPPWRQTPQLLAGFMAYVQGYLTAVWRKHTGKVAGAGDAEKFIHKREATPSGLEELTGHYSDYLASTRPRSPIIEDLDLPPTIPKKPESLAETAARLTAKLHLPFVKRSDIESEVDKFGGRLLLTDAGVEVTNGRAT